MSILDQNTERMALLRGWLKTRLAPAQIAWLDDQIIRVSKSNAGPALALAIGLAPRKLGKSDQTARILFVLASFDGDEARFAARLDKFFIGGEIGEHMALFRGLPLYPGPERLIARAAEGIRSAVQPVFEAVAHANPYPHEQFSETQWNQMVLKALFIGSSLDPIQGLDERRNADLAKMLIDYAHERWAAGRPVKRRISWQAIV